MFTSLNPIGRRVISAVPTPFDAQGRLDVSAAAEMARRLAAGSLDGAFVAGTTGEFPALSADERIELFAAWRSALGEKRLVAHVGAASTREVVELVSRSRQLGIVEFAAITPYFLPADAASTRRHYERIAGALDGGRLYVYLYQARTGTTVTPAQLAELAAIPGLVGAKISGIGLSEVAAYRDAVPAGFELYSGFDADFPLVSDAGLTGAVSGVSSLLPEPFELMIAALDGSPEEREQAAAGVAQAVAAVRADIARIKRGFALRGLPIGQPRMPMAEPDATAIAALEAAIAAAAALGR